MNGKIFVGGENIVDDQTLEEGIFSTPYIFMVNFYLKISE